MVGSAWLCSGTFALADEPGAVAAAGAPCPLVGHVLDEQGLALRQADVTLLSPSSLPLVRTRTDASGAFALDAVAPGTYVVEARAKSFASARRMVRLDACPHAGLDVRLGLGGVSEVVTVTPVAAESRSTLEIAPLVTVTSEGSSVAQAAATLPELLRGETGVSIQKTTTSQASAFVRGLTGQHVVALVDGVRFNTATFRPGANQYLAFIDTGAVDRIEVVRGPGGVAYGSDALGGTINVLTRETGWGRPRFGARGAATVSLASADESAAIASSLGGGSRRWGFFADATLQSHGDLRAGGGRDSHSVATRLLGLPSTALGTSLAQTGYRQQSGTVKVDLRPRPTDGFTLQAMRGAQRGASRYDQLDGGAGNLIHRFDPQQLDFAIARYDRLGIGPIDTLSVRTSYNRQQDDRVVQNVNNTRRGLLSPIAFEENRTTALGGQLTATRSRHRRHRLSGGLEMYRETVDSTRRDRQLTASAGLLPMTTVVRGRYPDGTRFTTFGLFGQYTWEPVSRLTLSASARYSRFTYSQGPSDAQGAPLDIPVYRNVLDDGTYQASAVLRLARDVVASVQMSRGFRAPNVNDRGTIGLSGNGFEVPPEEAVRRGARVVPFGSASAVGAPEAAALDPERLWNYEVGLRARRGRVSASLAVFRADLFDLIERNVVVLPPGAAGGVIGGEEIVRQDALGAIYTSLASTPVFVRTNAGHVRLQGAEGAVSLRLLRHVTLDANASYVRGDDLETNRPPGLENGIPPLHGAAVLRWQAPQRRWWAQATILAAARQSRFSANDLAQARIGGFRTASEIANFFNNGAVARGLVREGRLVATGETLPQVVARVLGPAAATGAPLFTSQAGYVSVGAAAGLRLAERWTAIVAVDNLADTNYRVMGSGIDGPGRSVRLVQTVTF